MLSDLAERGLDLAEQRHRDARRARVDAKLGALPVFGCGQQRGLERVAARSRRRRERCERAGRERAVELDRQELLRVRGELRNLPDEPALHAAARVAEGESAGEADWGLRLFIEQDGRSDRERSAAAVKPDQKENRAREAIRMTSQNRVGVPVGSRSRNSQPRGCDYRDADAPCSFQGGCMREWGVESDARVHFPVARVFGTV